MNKIEEEIKENWPSAVEGDLEHPELGLIHNPATLFARPVVNQSQLGMLQITFNSTGPVFFDFFFNLVHFIGDIYDEISNC
jgi:hypothetical protein